MLPLLRRTRLGVALLAVLTGAAAVVLLSRPHAARPAAPAPPPSIPVVADHFSQGGVRVDLEITPVGPHAQGAPLREAEDVTVRVHLSDASSGAPLSGNVPGAWIGPREAGGPADDKACTEHIKRSLDTRFPSVSTVSLNDYYLLALNADETISVIDPRAGLGTTRLLSMVVLDGHGTDWALSGDQSRLYVAVPSTGKVAVVDTHDYALVKSIDAGPSPARVALQPDGGYLWVLPASGAEAVVIATSSGAVAARIDVGRGAHDIAFSDDSATAFITSGEAGTVTVVDVGELRAAGTILVGGGLGRVAFSRAAGAAYVPSAAEGVVAVVDAGRRAVTARVPVGRGVGGIAFEPKGRFGFAWNTADSMVSVLDASSNRIVQKGDVDPGPDQITFTDALAYVHQRGSSSVGMIPLDQIGEGKRLTMASFPAGQNALGSAATAPGIVQAGTESAVLVANPKDKTIYFYKEGMAAPMGGYSAYSHAPEAMLILDRSLRERSPGVYETVARLPPEPGPHLVSLVLDSPRLQHCFALDLAAAPDRPPPPRGVAFEAVGDSALVPRTPAHVRIRLTDPKSKEPIDGLADVTVLVYLAPGRWNQRVAAVGEGAGVYAVDFTPPEDGAYYLVLEAPSLGVTLKTSPKIVLWAEVDGGTR